VPRLTTLDDILFPVEAHSVFVSIKEPSGERRLPVPDKKAIVNAKTRYVLGIVSRSYRLVTNHEALSMAYQCCRAVCPATKDSEWSVSAADAPSTGGHCCIDLVHNSTALDFTYVPAGERPNAFGPFIRVTNSYNTLRALAFDIGVYRKVCKNGLILPDSVISFKFTHSQSSIRGRIDFQVVHDRLAKLNNDFREYLGALRACKVPRHDLERVVRAALRLKPPHSTKPEGVDANEWYRLTEYISGMTAHYAAELGENAYADFNIITDFASQPPDNRCVHRDRHSLQRLAGLWVTTFVKECRNDTFNLPKYLEQLEKPNMDERGRAATLVSR
jgi:hypothetical protein